MLAVVMYALFFLRKISFTDFFFSKGFHVHVNPVAETSPNCTAAGGHFNPYSKLCCFFCLWVCYLKQNKYLDTSHGPRTPDIWNRHVGDLGNITTDENGTVAVAIQDNIIQFYNVTQSIADRTIVVHLMYDDGGFGTGDSSTTGYSFIYDS